MILYKRDFIIFGLMLTSMVLYLLQKQLVVDINLQANKLEKIQKESKTYQIQNNTLKLQYLHGASYHTIYQKATRSGFIPVSNSSYIYL